MTDQGDLRDRIAAVIRSHGTPVGIDTGEADEFDCCAQAIIDDLGLRVEFGDGREDRYRRVVGKWEVDR